MTKFATATGLLIALTVGFVVVQASRGQAASSQTSTSTPVSAFAGCPNNANVDAFTIPAGKTFSLTDLIAAGNPDFVGSVTLEAGGAARVSVTVPIGGSTNYSFSTPIVFTSSDSPIVLACTGGSAPAFVASLTISGTLK